MKQQNSKYKEIDKPERKFTKLEITLAHWIIIVILLAVITIQHVSKKEMKKDVVFLTQQYDNLSARLDSSNKALMIFIRTTPDYNKMFNVMRKLGEDNYELSHSTMTALREKYFEGESMGGGE